MSETQTIHCEQLLDHPPARVWAALTEPELQARWWSAGDIRPVVGHRFTLDMAEWGHQQCEVIEVEPSAGSATASPKGSWTPRSPGRSSPRATAPG